MVLDTYNELYLPYYWSHFIIWHRGLGCQNNLQENHVLENPILVVGSDLSFHPSLEVTFSP